MLMSIDNNNIDNRISLIVTGENMAAVRNQLFLEGKHERMCQSTFLRDLQICVDVLACLFLVVVVVVGVSHFRASQKSRWWAQATSEKGAKRNKNLHKNDKRAGIK